MSLKSFSVALLVLFIVAVPARAQEETAETLPDSVTAERILVGSNLYHSGSCMACHAIGGRGSGRRAPDLSDVEWLHSEGDFDGIFDTIFWGVTKDEFKAVTPRPFEMHPRGGMTIDREQVKALAAYVWTISHRDLNEFVDAQATFLDHVSVGQADEAVALFRQWRDRDPENLLLPDNGLNQLGYVIMLGPRQSAEEAIELFELNVETNPDSWNAYDSLGEAYMTAGDTPKAIENYERSLEINPENDNAREKLGELRG